MEPDGRTYLLPYPVLARVVMALAGAFVVVVTPMGLWRGVWPLNAMTPFFALILFGGLSVGWAFLSAGLLAPAIRLHFAPGRVEISRDFPWGSTRQVVAAADILAFAVEESETSDGPNEWYAVLRLRSGTPLRSRPLGTRAAAERQLAAFRAALDAGED